VSSVTPATDRTYKVLIVEDDAQILRVLELELKHEGYEVETARDGLSGLERALKEPDLVVLDLMLPKLDGMEVCARIRAKSSVPIIMLTAKDRIPDRVAGLDHGADDYLTSSRPKSTRCSSISCCIATRCTPATNSSTASGAAISSATPT
jgi:CheY-like chemotaxis protein